jgi:hypothetical protein
MADIPFCEITHYTISRTQAECAPPAEQQRIDEMNRLIDRH